MDADPKKAVPRPDSGSEVTQPATPPHPDQGHLSSPGVPDAESLRGLFPDLEIHHLLGAGGMGAVYKARQSRLNRFVALKVMTCSPGHATDFALRFEREAQVLARLNHPHIVIIYDFGDIGHERTGGAPLFYFLMEYVDGTDLAQLISSKLLTPGQSLAIVPQICDALQYAHDQGITHRDIKPANILIDQKGTVKIADFGLAKMGGGNDDGLMTGLTQTGTAMGTPHYMAPEQWENPDQVDHRADIYALGVVFYEMLTGERPAGVFEAPSKFGSTDKKLDSVVLRAMERSPERRYQQASEIKSDVTRISTAQPHSAPDGKTRSSRLKSLYIIGAGAALLAGGWIYLQQPSNTDQLSQTPRLSQPNITVPSITATASPSLWQPAFPDLTKLPGLVEIKDGWASSSHLNVVVPNASGAGLKQLNVGIRCQMRFAEGSGTETAQLILRRGSHGGDHFELRYYRNLSGTQPNQFQIRHWDNASQQSTLLASAEVPEAVHDAPGGFLLAFYAIGNRLHGTLNGTHPITATVPDEAFVNPGELGFAHLDYCWLKDMEILNLDGLSEAEALKLTGAAVPYPSTDRDGVSIFSAGAWTRIWTPEEEKQWIARREDDWMLSKNKSIGPWWQDKDRAATNGGLRARFRGQRIKVADTNYPQLNLREGSAAGIVNLFVYKGAKLQIRQGQVNEDGSMSYPAIAEILLKKQISDPAQEYTMELYTIGRTVIGRVNGETVTAQLTIPPGPGRPALYGTDNGFFRDVHFINLDGLSEAEALKLAGAPETSVDSQASPGSASVRRWTPVWPNPQDIPNVDTVTDGWAVTNRGSPGINLGKQVVNGGLRARFCVSKDSPPPQLLLRRQGDQIAYNLMLIYGGGLHLRRNDPATHNRNVELKKFVVPIPPAVGEEYVLEFLAVGRTLIARLNDKTFEFVLDENAPDPEPGDMRLYQVDTNIFRNVEVLNLDGLPEAEALRLAKAAPDTFTHGRSHYALINENLPWPDARKRAEAMGGTLAVFETMTEESKVRDHFKPQLGQGAWIGGYAQEGSSDLRWVDGNAVEKISWSVGHPFWREKPDSQGAQTEGVMWPAGLVLTGSSVQIHAQSRTDFGYLLEWTEEKPSISGRIRAAGLSKGGQPHDLSKLAPFDDFIDVAGGWHDWTALRANGQTISSDGKSDHSGIQRIVRGLQDKYGFINSTGHLVVPPGFPIPPPEALLKTKIVDADFGRDHGIVLTPDGTAITYGKRYEETIGDWKDPTKWDTPRWPAPPSDALHEVIDIAVTSTHAATLRKNGKVSLWGWEGVATWSPEPALKRVVKIESGDDTLALLDEAGQVWTYYLPRSPSANKVVRFDGKLKLITAYAIDLREQFWLSKNGTWQSLRSELNIRLSDIPLPDDTAFSLATGFANGKPHTSLLWIEPASRIPSTLSRKLTAMGTLRDGKPIDLTKAAGITDFTQVVLHDKGWISLRSNGQTVASDGRGERSHIAKICPGIDTVFALIDDQDHVEMFARLESSENPNTQLPTDVNQIGVVDLFSDEHHAIALLKDGSARVWGNHYDNPKAVPEWMDREPWSRPPPEALTKVQSIAITPLSASTVTTDGRLWTWGKPSSVQIPTNAAALQGQYAAVISCNSGLYDALTEDGTRVSFNLSLRDAQIAKPGIIASAYGGYRPLHRRPDGQWSTGWNRPEFQPFFDAIQTRPASTFSLMFFHEGDDHESIGLLTLEPQR